jgi:hypothetical protein
MDDGDDDVDDDSDDGDTDKDRDGDDKYNEILTQITSSYNKDILNKRNYLVVEE